MKQIWKSYVVVLIYAIVLIMSIIEFVITDLWYRSNNKYQTILVHQIGFITRFSGAIVLMFLFLIFKGAKTNDIAGIIFLFLSNGVQIFLMCQLFKSCDFMVWERKYLASSKQSLLNWNEFSQAVVIVICIIAAALGCLRFIK